MGRESRRPLHDHSRRTVRRQLLPNQNHSPNGCTVASAGADEFLKFWNVFGSPEIAEPATNTSNAGPFTNMIHIR